jgi:hypothetical protein
MRGSYDFLVREIERYGVVVVPKIYFAKEDPLLLAHRLEFGERMLDKDISLFLIIISLMSDCCSLSIDTMLSR